MGKNRKAVVWILALVLLTASVIALTLFLESQFIPEQKIEQTRSSFRINCPASGGEILETFTGQLSILRCDCSHTGEGIVPYSTSFYGCGVLTAQ